MTIWALFDSGNGCYKQAVEKYFPDIDIYSVGIDIENKNNHFLNLNLADYSELFGKGQMFDCLDELPKPDIILASPPCESWSNASAMLNGNACWQTAKISTLFGECDADNRFTLRTKKELATRDNTQFKKFWWKTVYSRINGELCAFNTIRIIEKYCPQVWIIENPQSSRIWDYFYCIQDFKGIKNVTHYNAYDDEFPRKATIFYSNIDLNLKTSFEKSKVIISPARGDNRKVIRSYNQRSNIPLTLIRDMLEKCLTKIK